MWIGMRWTVRDILYYSVDFLSQEPQGIKAPPLKWETYKDPWSHNEVVFDEDANQNPPSGFSAVESMGPPALSERISGICILDYGDFKLIGKRSWALSGC